MKYDVSAIHLLVALDFILASEAAAAVFLSEAVGDRACS